MVNNNPNGRIASSGLGHPVDAAHRHRDPRGIRWTAPGQRHLGRDVPGGSERSSNLAEEIEAMARNSGFTH